MQQNYRARVMSAIAELDRWMVMDSFAADMDAGFDGGEWSGPAHDRMCDREMIRIACRWHVIDLPGEYHVWTNQYEEC